MANGRMIEIVCPQCECPVLRPAHHLTRAKRLGRNVYCGLACAGLAARKGDVGRRAKDRERDQVRRIDPAERLKRAARRITRAAITSGQMTRGPCEVCGAKAEAHHDDYSKPLDVRWLCPPHHRQHHLQADAQEAA